MANARCHPDAVLGSCGVGIAQVIHIRTRTVGAASIRDEVIIHTSNPNSAENWVWQMFTDPPLSGLKEATEHVRARTEADLRWDGFLQRNDTPQKEPHVMTPYEMFILYAIHAVTQSRLPDYASEITHQALTSLLKAEMIESNVHRVSGFSLTERARVYLNAITMLPLPVRTTPPWVMPKPKSQDQ